MSVCDTCIHKGTSNCSDWEFSPPTSFCRYAEEAPVPKPTLADYIKELESDLMDYNNPASYQESEWYETCRIRADLLEGVIRRLKEL